MRRLLLTAAAERDIRSALGFNARHWGTAQAAAYRRLIAAAIEALLDDPLRPASRARDEVRPGVRTLHIGRPGRPARHMVVYRVSPVGDLEILRVLHDAMELQRHLEVEPV